jgi:hypothetical protein
VIPTAYTLLARRREPTLDAGGNGMESGVVVEEREYVATKP